MLSIAFDFEVGRSFRYRFQTNKWKKQGLSDETYSIVNLVHRLLNQASYYLGWGSIGDVIQSLLTIEDASDENIKNTASQVDKEAETECDSGEQSPSSIEENSSLPTEVVKPGKKKKSVRFNNTVKVVLIPTCSELKTAGCLSELWRNKEDAKKTLNEAKKEIQEYLQINPSVNCKEAKKMLYQPNGLGQPIMKIPVRYQFLYQRQLYMQKALLDLGNNNSAYDAHF